MFIAKVSDKEIFEIGSYEQLLPQFIREYTILKEI